MGLRLFSFPMILPLVSGLASTSLTPEERALFTREQPAGYILFSRNIASVAQVRALTDELRGLSRYFDPLICIDQEGGRVVRTAALGLTTPSAADLGQAGDPGLVVEAAALTGQALRLLGITMNLAPVLDIGETTARANALPSRCWGEDLQQVIDCAGIYNRTMRREGVDTCAKHFPGMGRAESDPHHSLPVIRAGKDAFMAFDTVPFMTLAPELPAMMIAHLLIPDIDPVNPSSLSPALVTDFLRNQLGYDGLVLTDDLCMGAITCAAPPDKSCVKALLAGCDLPLLCHDSLEHLPLAAERIRKMTFEQLADPMRRIEKRLWGMTTPPPMKVDLWEALLERAAKLRERLPAHTQGQIPSSPVQEY